MGNSEISGKPKIKNNRIAVPPETFWNVFLPSASAHAAFRTVIYGTVNDEKTRELVGGLYIV